MKHNIPNNIMSDLSHLLSDKLGLYFPSEKWIDLERGILDVTHLYHFKDPIECISWLKNISLTQSEIERLASHFTVGETYFFRDTGSFEALEKKILPRLIELGEDKGKALRIWSAGCSTGEEPYSIAILLNKLLKNISDWNITILASDINIISLKRLQEGLYTDWSFRNVPNDIKETYFKKTGNNRYEILPYLKKMVTAIYLNLAEDTYPSLLNSTNAMDLILCRNTLMYFESYQATKVVEKLKNSLVKDGYFMVGASEYFLVKNTLFKPLKYPDTIIYQKKEEPISLSFESDLVEELQPYPIIVNPEIIIDEEQSTFKPPVIETQQEESNSRQIESTAKSLANQGKLKEALALVEEEISIDKCNANTRYLKALILQELGFVNEAILEFRKSIYLDQNFILSYFSLANIARSQGNIKDSKKYFSIVLSLLENYAPEAVIPDSDGMTVERMRESLDLVSNSKQ